MKLAGKVAVITGTASGSGKATALLFASQGALVLGIDQDQDGGRETARRIKAEGGQADFFHADLGLESGVRESASFCLSRSSAIDILFNNAGILARSNFVETSFDEWQRHIAIHLTAPFLLSQLLVTAMAGRQASIIHHGTIDGTLGNPMSAAYSASKGGLVPLTHVMAQTLGPMGIRVNCICSAGIRTSESDIIIRLTPELRAGEIMSDMQRRVTPLGRAGTVEEIARVARFLACGDSSYVNGSVITVDGGRSGLTQGTF